MALRLMFISSNYPPRVGGPATTVPKFARLLSAKNKVSVVAFREKGSANFEDNGFELYRSPSFYSFGFSNPLSVFIRTVLLSFYARKITFVKNPSIIHAHDTHISAIAALFSKYTSFWRRRVIVKYAGDMVLEFCGLQNMKGGSIEYLLNHPSFLQRVLFLVQRSIFWMADYLHVQNEYQRKILVDYYHVAPQKIFIIPNPVDIKLFSSKSHKISKSSSTKTLLIVSRIVPWKGIDTAIKALALVLKKDSSFELKIIGDGSFECVKSLKLLGMRLGIEKKIHFAGRVANANLPLEYARCKVFLQPSLYEPFGISAIESFSCGRPAVVSNVGGLVELAKGAPAALMFEKGNETDLAKKILLAGKFSSAQCSKNILFAKKYEIKKIVKLLESFYIQINPK